MPIINFFKKKDNQAEAPYFVKEEANDYHNTYIAQEEPINRNSPYDEYEIIKKIDEEVLALKHRIAFIEYQLKEVEKNPNFGDITANTNVQEHNSLLERQQKLMEELQSCQQHKLYSRTTQPIPYEPPGIRYEEPPHLREIRERFNIKI